jgi:hypothetical protein
MKKLNVFRLTLLIAQNVQRKLEWNSFIGPNPSNAGIGAETVFATAT